jgi:hypothetical protein
MGTGRLSLEKKVKGRKNTKQTWLRAESGRVWVKLDSDRQISAQLGSGSSSLARCIAGLGSTRLILKFDEFKLDSARLASHTQSAREIEF